MNRRTAALLASMAAVSMGMFGESHARRGSGCVNSLESIRRGVKKRRAAKSAKAARRRNRGR
jgi:hypothetical protein